MQREHVLDCQSERNCTRTSLRQDNIFTCVPGAPLTFTFSPRLTKGVEPFVYIAAFVTGVGGQLILSPLFLLWLWDSVQ